MRQSATVPPQAVQAGCLAPLLAGCVRELVHGNPGLLHELTRVHGSPLHVVWPHLLQENARAMASVLEAHDLPFQLFYGAKVNKSPGLVRAARQCGIGVDVSSLYELRDALAAGAHGAYVVATGPAKPDDFLHALVEARCLVSVDGLEEFDTLQQIARAHGGPAPRALLRYRPHAAAASRFGMGADELLHCMRMAARPESALRFDGFHFHLSGYDHAPRAQAVAELAAHVDAARSMGLVPRMIDIGGGLPIRYVDAGAYEDFLQGQHAGDYRTGRVPASFYPYGCRVDACEWLRRFLASPCHEGQSVGRYLRDTDCSLAIEPGRSLADQAAISVFRVHSSKLLAQGGHVVFVEGSSFSACETWFSSEFLVDPLLIPCGPRAQVPTRAYIAGHSCLDDDVITNRWIGFPTVPQRGDLLVYANTAGYQMDLLENEFHRHPMPHRLLALQDAAGALRFEPDKPVE